MTRDIKNKCIESAATGSNMISLTARADSYFFEKNWLASIEEYGRILGQQPQHAHALYCAGLAFFFNNQPEQALEYLNRAALVTPDRADIWELCGLLAAFAKKWTVAERFYRRAIQALGNSAVLYRNLADCLHASERDSEAAEHYAKALELDPGLGHALRSLADICEKRGDRSVAAHYRLRAWSLDSSSLQDGLDLINAMAKSGCVSEIEHVVTHLSARFSSDADALEFLSRVQNQNDRYADGFRLATLGLEVAPENPLLHYNAARALWMCGLPCESLPHALEADRLLQDDAGVSVKYFLSCVQLAVGDFDNGWKHHRYFYTYPLLRSQLTSPNFPEWNGERLTGCRFLYVLHQGFGDQIQFLRFAEWLHRQGATVDVLVDQQIAGIAGSMTSIRRVYSYPTVPAGPYEYWCHMMKLPEHIGLDLKMLPIATSYFSPECGKLEHWRSFLNSVAPRGAGVKAKRIAFVWQGSPNTATDRFRSIRLEVLRPLLAVPFITWLSVQKGHTEETSKSLSDEFDVHALGPLIGDFTDTLAILETVDLLITVDSSPAHLAGARGLPVWVLLPAYSEWRWLVDRTDSPWYPSMRLFRQRRLGEWDAVIEEVRDALQEWHAAQPCSIDAGS
jgi:tetratricopeptide (TPR) repeat protein